jgi:hypothetical protein
MHNDAWSLISSLLTLFSGLVCGAGSVLSEYELYYHYSLQMRPDTIELRGLRFVNGPSPGRVMSCGTLCPDGISNHWILCPDSKKFYSHLKDVMTSR